MVNGTVNGREISLNARLMPNLESPPSILRSDRPNRVPVPLASTISAAAAAAGAAATSRCTTLDSPESSFQRYELSRRIDPAGRRYRTGRRRVVSAVAAKSNEKPSGFYRVFEMNQLLNVPLRRKNLHAFSTEAACFAPNR